MMKPGYRRNLQVLAPCIAVLGVMCGIVIYSPTLYRMFCAATGYGGTTQRVLSDSATISPKTVTVEFDSNVAPGLPWRFEPLQRNVTVHLGEQKLVFFTAENTGNDAMIGHATFNVTPQTSGIYFNKIQCFCFSEERLAPHQKVNMPVVFFVDPAFGNDPEMQNVWVWLATDCDREGQLIGQEILEHYEYRGQVMRVMFTAQDFADHPRCIRSGKTK